MRLTYRGASYEAHNNPLEARESDILSLSQQQRRCRTVQEHRYPLRYRGTRYMTDPVATALSTPSVGATAMTYRGIKYVREADGSTHLDEFRNCTVPHTTLGALRQLSKVHQENLRLNLERRLEAARSRGDAGLVQLLEVESKQLAL